MKKNKKNRINVVYSTNPDFQFEEENNGVEETLAAAEQSLYVSLDKKNRGGKAVTMVEGFIGLEEDLKSLGKELADKNIAVNAVTPAGAKTRILDQMTKEHVQRMLSKVPRGRFLEVEEFTSLVCWLSSEENTFSTAAVFDISGGRSTY